MQIFRGFFAVLLGVFPTKTLGFLLNLTVGKVWDISVGSNRRPRRFSLPLWAGDIVSSHSISRDIFQILPPPKKRPHDHTEVNLFLSFHWRDYCIFPGNQKKGLLELGFPTSFLLVLRRKGGGGENSLNKVPWRVIASLLKEVFGEICLEDHPI